MVGYTEMTDRQNGRMPTTSAMKRTRNARFVPTSAMMLWGFAKELYNITAVSVFIHASPYNISGDVVAKRASEAISVNVFGGSVLKIGQHHRRIWLRTRVWSHIR